MKTRTHLLYIVIIVALALLVAIPKVSSFFTPSPTPAPTIYPCGTGILSPADEYGFSKLSILTKDSIISEPTGEGWEDMLWIMQEGEKVSHIWKDSIIVPASDPRLPKVECGEEGEIFYGYVDPTLGEPMRRPAYDEALVDFAYERPGVWSCEWITSSFQTTSQTDDLATLQCKFAFLEYFSGQVDPDSKVWVNMDEGAKPSVIVFEPWVQPTCSYTTGWWLWRKEVTSTCGYMEANSSEWSEAQGDLRGRILEEVATILGGPPESVTYEVTIQWITLDEPSYGEWVKK